MESFWKDTVDGSEILHQLIGYFLSHYLEEFFHQQYLRIIFLFKLSWPTQIFLFKWKRRTWNVPFDYSWTSPKQAIRGFMFGDMCERSWSSWWLSHTCLYLLGSSHILSCFLDTVLYLINSPFSKYFKYYTFSNMYIASYTSRPASRNETNEPLWFIRCFFKPTFGVCRYV